MCYEADDYCDFYTEDVRRSRKQRRCDACCEQIEAGHLYHACSFKFDGDFGALSTCGTCMAMTYALHLFELYEGCPNHTSWYPPEAAREEIERLRGDVEYYAKEEDQREGYGEDLIRISPLFDKPSVEDGQRYLRATIRHGKRNFRRSILSGAHQ